MAGVYSVCFHQGRRGWAGSEDMYVVPDGYVAVIRDIIMYIEGDATPGLIGVYVLQPGEGDSNPCYIVREASPSPGVLIHWTGRQPLAAGGHILSWNFASFLVVRVSGYLLHV